MIKNSTGHEVTEDIYYFGVNTINIVNECNEHIRIFTCAGETKTKKFRQIKIILIPKCSLHSDLQNAYQHLLV